MIRFRWPFYGLRFRWPFQWWRCVAVVRSAEFIPEVWSDELIRSIDESVEATRAVFVEDSDCVSVKLYGPEERVL